MTPSDFELQMALLQEKFLEKAPEHINEIIVLLDKELLDYGLSNPEVSREIHGKAHKLKGTAAQFNATELKDLSSIIEKLTATSFTSLSTKDQEALLGAIDALYPTNPS